MMPNPRLAARYAKSILGLSIEKGQLENVYNDMLFLHETCRSSREFVNFLRSPVIKREAAGKAVAALAKTANFNALTANFLGLLAKNRRLFELAAMIKAFRSLLADSRGEVAAEVVSATPLSDKHLAAIADALKASTGAKVALSPRVDPALLGGMIVRVGSRMVDSSLRTKLSKLELAMKGIG